MFGGVPLSATHRVVRTPDELAAMVAACRGRAVSYDTETDGLRWANGKRPIAFGVGFLDENSTPWAWYAPFGHRTMEPQANPEHAKAALRDVLGGARELIGHNLKFDILMSRAMGVEVPGSVPLHDTMVGAQLVREDRQLQLELVVNQEKCSPWGDALAMKARVEEFIGSRAKAHKLPVKKDDKESGRWSYKSKFGHSEVPVGLEAEYCCRDVVHALVLDRKQRGRAMGQGEPFEARRRWLYHNEMDLVRALADMEWVGQRIDRDYFLRLAADLDVDLARRAADLTTLWGRRVRWDNDNDLRSFLYDDLKLPVVLKTDSGGPSIERAALMILRDPSRTPYKLQLEALAEYRVRLKVRQTYTVGLAFECGDDGRVHTSFRQTGTETGRMSSDHPNLQNIPTRHPDMAKAVRRGFLVDEGGVRVFGDYSQVELRGIAWVTGSRSLTASYRSPAYDDYLGNRLDYDAYVARRHLEPEVDVHADQARASFGAREADDDWKVKRRAAKIINFGVPYGMTAMGLNTNPELLLPIEQAEDYFERYHAGNPEVRAAQVALFRKMRSERPVRFVNWMGRCRHVPALVYNNEAAKRAAEREAFASLIQGSAAELTRISIVRLWRMQRDGTLGGRLTSTVHDEVQADADRGQRDAVAYRVRRVMEDFRGYFGSIPIVCELEATETTWAEKEKMVA